MLAARGTAVDFWGVDVAVMMLVHGVRMLASFHKHNTVTVDYGADSVVRETCSLKALESAINLQ